jgi:hypothetical protein
MDGYVYALQGTLNGVEYTKIGKTGNPTRRARQLARQLPFPVTMITRFPCPDESAVEAELHQKFADKHIYGEWFVLDDDDLMYLQAVEDEIITEQIREIQSAKWRALPPEDPRAGQAGWGEPGFWTEQEAEEWAYLEHPERVHFIGRNIYYLDPLE